jgi:hypothetical protein
MSTKNYREYQDGYTNRLGTTWWQKDTFLGQQLHRWGEQDREREAAAAAASSQPIQISEAGSIGIVLMLECCAIQYVLLQSCAWQTMAPYCVKYFATLQNLAGVPDRSFYVWFGGFIWAIVYALVCMASRLINWTFCVVVVSCIIYAFYPAGGFIPDNYPTLLILFSGCAFLAAVHRSANNV